MAGSDVIIVNMSEPANASDLELLARYNRHHAEDAFATLVRRHVDLVHSAALRQVRSPELAEEVTQTTFTKLARLAPQLATDTILTAWLYQVTRREAIDVVRREARRQLREQIATELNTMNATTADWAHIEPILDEAMAELDETDRAAVLLRYFENKSLREVGATLGTSDDAAQKRVSRAVERLREFFAKRGITVGTSGLAVVISANAVQAAPVGLAITISTAAALAGTTFVTTTTATAIKTIAMTTLQKTVITATLAVVAGVGIYEARQASQLREQVQTLQQQAPLAEQIEQLQHERDNVTNRLTSLQDDNERLNRNTTELLRLRAEVARLRENQTSMQNPTVLPALQSEATTTNADSSAMDIGRELGLAVLSGDPEAFDKLWEMSKVAHKNLNAEEKELSDERKSKLALRSFAPLRTAFEVIGEAAAKGNQYGLEAVTRAQRIAELQGQTPQPTLELLQ